MDLLRRPAAELEGEARQILSLRPARLLLQQRQFAPAVRDLRLQPHLRPGDACSRLPQFGQDLLLALEQVGEGLAGVLGGCQQGVQPGWGVEDEPTQELHGYAALLDAHIAFRNRGGNR